MVGLALRPDRTTRRAVPTGLWDYDQRLFLVDFMDGLYSLPTMSSTNCSRGGANSGLRRNGLLKHSQGCSSTPWNWLSMMVALAIATVAQPCLAGERDDLYLESFHIIQQADALQKSGNSTAALAKYQKAQTALQEFRRTYPDFGVKMVAFRLNYVTEKIAAAPEKPEAENSAGAQAAVASPIKLLSAGAEPRKVLRLHPKAGDKQSLGVEIKMGMEMEVNGQNQAVKLPAIKMPMEVTVKEVSAGGDITYESIMGEPSLGDDGGNAQVAEAMKASLGSVKGLTGSGTMSSRGIVKSTQMKVSPGADAQVRQAMDQMKDSLAQMAAPLPEEAVGPGAKWEYTKPIKMQGMTINQTATYELVSTDGENIVNKSSFVQNAANQKIQNPAMPGMNVDLTKMSGRGKGEVKHDLGQLMPAEATVESHSDFSMGVNAGGQKQSMNMKIDLNLRIQAQ